MSPNLKLTAYAPWDYSYLDVNLAQNKQQQMKKVRANISDNLIIKIPHGHPEK